MDDAVQALIMAFSAIVFVIGLSISMYMFSKVTTTAETLLYLADETNYYDSIELYNASSIVKGEESAISQMTRYVDVETIVPTLYRYYKENYCVKIYGVDGSGDTYLIQYFDIDTETEVRKAASATTPTAKQKALNTLYNNRTDVNYKRLYMFEAPWTGSTDENMKKRVDYFVNGKSGYINDTHVDYTNNDFYRYREHNRNATTDDDKIYFIEQFLSYTYTGDTYTDEETGEVLVDGAQPDDKIVIIYTATESL